MLVAVGFCERIGENEDVLEVVGAAFDAGLLFRVAGELAEDLLDLGLDF